MGEKMSNCKASCSVLLVFFIVGLCSVCQYSSAQVDANQTANLIINASISRPIPETLFGIFFEEINHAGAGGIWAELVSNRGFEAGGQNTPSNIAPWSIIGDQSSLNVSTDRSSCFERNKVALQMDVLCDSKGSNICPAGGVGIYNPGFWGMNIEQGKVYKVVLFVRSLGSINVSVSLTSSDGSKMLATANILDSDVSNWTKVEVLLEATGTNPNSRLQLTTSRKGVIWFDQVSAMPVDTYKGHGFRNELIEMLDDIKPQFIRFPGGCFIEGEWLRNAFRWKESIGPWEERPGHFGDVWMYWTDDGLGYFEFLQVVTLVQDYVNCGLGSSLEIRLAHSVSEEDIIYGYLFLQLAEDLGSRPIWVFNNGISHQDQVDTTAVLPFVQEALDGLEFARGDSNSKWGSVRAAMGHPEPFDLKYVAVGNEDCGKKNYRGNYLKFYNAIRSAYPDIKIISNCDGSSRPLDHPADYYDFHIYTSASNLFSMTHQFDRTSRTGPKAFVSEYAVTGKDAGTGSLLAALAEAGFLIGLEKNSDIVEMASYAPLFVNVNDRRYQLILFLKISFKHARQGISFSFQGTLKLTGTILCRWNPDAIVFNSSKHYGTPSYWVQKLFRESSGANLLDSKLQTNSSTLVASAITWQNSDGKTYLKIKIVNFGNSKVNLKVSIDGLGLSSQLSESTKTVLTSSNLMDENSFSNPKKVVPAQTLVENADKDMDLVLTPYSVTSFDLLTESNSIRMPQTDSFSRSSI
uniref:non-reducing end alpha-L-arabinofuranosidase n=1 Tax=Salix viminalis TaxID=40686 RepID=A0A6N2KSZ9_SALVM